MYTLAVGYALEMKNPNISDKAIVEEDVTLGDNSKVWHFAHLRKGSCVGSDTVIGSRVFIDVGVKVGNRCKIQNDAKLYSSAMVADNVFIGPSVILTNDKFPRAVNLSGQLKSNLDWSKSSVVIEEGASVGAGAICIAPLVIGAWSLVAAGAVVVRDVPDFAMVAGNPARFIKWVGKSGFPLQKISENEYKCPKSNESYILDDFGRLKLI